MVMEPPPSASTPPRSISPPPSPQSVGREFVRQYYTLLNQSPIHLHRFYSHNSSFIHGGLDVGDKVSEPVTGQQEIHQKIMQLNFRDCHAKIRQVDAHATLESGVVVQVSGELSNSGKPMRRFMQTFVLAPQSPKKYYVHNDIFRYQDEVFSDEDQEGADSGTTSILDESNESVNQSVNNNNNAAKHAPEAKEPVVVSVNSNNNNNGESLHVNGGSAKAPLTAEAPVEEAPVEEPAVAAEDASEHGEDEDEGVIEERRSQVSNGPLTYATLVKSGQGSAAVSGQPSGPLPTPPIKGKSVGSPSEIKEPILNKGGGYRGRGGPMGGRGMPRERYGSASRDSEEDRRPRHSFGGPGDKGGSTSGAPGWPYPDAQQVFVGNLPHNCSEAELEALFSVYGKVLEIRISNKGASVTKSSAPGVRVPNYGFVVFEDERSTQECLKKRPIVLPDNHRINVEEKKNKARIEEARGGSAMGGNRQGNVFDRGSQDNLGGRGMSDRGGRGSSRGGSRGGGRGMYAGGQQGPGRGGHGGQQMGQRGGYNRRN